MIKVHCTDRGNNRINLLRRYFCYVIYFKFITNKMLSILPYLLASSKKNEARCNKRLKGVKINRLWFTQFSVTSHLKIAI